MPSKKKKKKKLALKKETLKRLSDQDLASAAGAAGPLTFTVACVTSNCITLGPLCPTSGCTLTFTVACVTSNCMTLGSLCHAL